MAVDYGLALTGESLAAMLVGVMQDDRGYTAGEVSIIMGYIAVFMTTAWSITFYIFHKPQLD